VQELQIGGARGAMTDDQVPGANHPIFSPT
jgi:hypothetical protein